MSRFEINKLILWIDEDAERVAAFHGDPRGWVDDWDRRGRAARLPLSDAGALAPAERDAFAERDYGRLYALGAHPYLLLHFARALDVVIEGVAWPDFVRDYKASVAPFGFPDFST